MNNNQTNFQNATMGHLGTAFLTWRRYLQQQLIDQEITLKQLFVLRRLAKREFLYPSEIAETLFCDRPTATVIINNMRRYGWVESRKQPDNRKHTQIRITLAGRAKLEALDAVSAEQSQPLFDPLACFTPDELCEFERLLATLNQHLAQHAKGDSDERDDENDI